MIAEILVKVSFLKHTLIKSDAGVVEGDYNTTKLIFDFEEDVSEGKILFKMSNPEGTPILLRELTSPEVTLVSYDEDRNLCTLFDHYGLYPCELVWYGNGGKLTSAPGWMNVSKRQVNITGDMIPDPGEPGGTVSVDLVTIDTLLGGEVGETPTSESVEAKIQALINKSNDTTGKGDTDLTAGVYSLASGYNPEGIIPEGELEITENGTHDVSGKKSAVVKVPIPDGYELVTYFDAETDIVLGEETLGNIAITVNSFSTLTFAHKTSSGDTVESKTASSGTVSFSDIASGSYIAITGGINIFDFNNAVNCTGNGSDRTITDIGENATISVSNAD